MLKCENWTGAPITGASSELSPEQEAGVQPEGKTISLLFSHSSRPCGDTSHRIWAAAMPPDVMGQARARRLCKPLGACLMN